MIEVSELMKKQGSSVFSQIEEMEHEQVVLCHDKKLGLKAIIAIHNTVLGPSMGGTRMWNYATDEEGVTDALRLSRGMTLKNSIAGLNLGGGKAVIIGDARHIKSEALMRRFGQFVNSLGGRYWTAEDVNMTTADMKHVRKETDYVTGTPIDQGGGGDPSPFTSFGVYMGMKAATKKAYGSDSLEGKKILVQGAGNVGYYLMEYLAKEGATLFVSDLDEVKINKAANDFGAEIVAPDKIFEIDCDIYSPNALGATINDQSISEMKCAVVAGGANNQLLDEKKHGQMLIDKGIVYGPDFLINGGGITNCYFEYIGEYDKQKVMDQTEKIYETTLKVLDHAESFQLTPQEAAIEIATKRIEDSLNK